MAIPTWTTPADPRLDNKVLVPRTEGGRPAASRTNIALPGGRR